MTPKTSTMTENRYASDWNDYSEQWMRRYGATYAHLGDEWNDDGTEARARDEHYFQIYAKRFLRPDTTVLEVGPGGGKWTVRIAPLVKKVIVLDVAETMLERTRERCEAAGVTNVEYIAGNGTDFRPVASGSVDLFFSYDVFVHIAIEDTFPYTGEIARVLKPGGVSVCHYAVASTPGAWERVEQIAWWYRGQAHTLGQYYYFSPESLRRMYEHAGLSIVESHQEWCYCTIIGRRLADSVVSQLEGALRAYIGSAPDSRERQAAIDEIMHLPSVLEGHLDTMVSALESAAGQEETARAAQRVRRLWRGL
jgi:ubiquinone/menaquinone biosynthesis C-methylase UbiE